MQVEGKPAPANCEIDFILAARLAHTLNIWKGGGSRSISLHV
jgi:hypothetical protein